MLDISCKPVHVFMDFNAVVVNLESMPKNMRQECLHNIEDNVGILESYLEENLIEKENSPDIPVTGKAVLKQQYALVQAIEEWVGLLRRELEWAGRYILPGIH